MDQKNGTFNKRYLMIFIPIIIGLVILGLFLTQNYEVGTKVGKKAPNFTAQTIKGENIELDNLKGKIVILDFMATWCPPCRKEIQHLKEVQSDYSDEKLRIISIGIDEKESIDELSTFKETNEINWILAKGSNLFENYEISSIPTIYILDEEGIITYKNVGVTSASELSESIEEIGDKNG